MVLLHIYSRDWIQAAEAQVGPSVSGYGPRLPCPLGQLAFKGSTRVLKQIFERF